MKIYQMNDYEWWLAETEEDAIRDLSSHYGLGSATKEEMIIDGFIGEGFPIEITSEDMDTLIYWDEMGNPGSLKRSFREEFQRRIDAGVTGAEMFASSEF